MIEKIRLLTQEQCEIEHEFWESSPNRRAMDICNDILTADPTIKAAKRAYFGEHQDGMWLWFFDGGDAARRFEMAMGVTFASIT